MKTFNNKNKSLRRVLIHPLNVEYEWKAKTLQNSKDCKVIKIWFSAFFCISHSFTCWYRCKKWRKWDAEKEWDEKEEEEEGKNKSVFTWSFYYWFMFAAFLFTIAAKTPLSSIKTGEREIQNGHLYLQGNVIISKQSSALRLSSFSVCVFWCVLATSFNLECWNDCWAR